MLALQLAFVFFLQFLQPLLLAFELVLWIAVGFATCNASNKSAISFII
jgi:hypothetical protein